MHREVERSRLGSTLPHLYICGFQNFGCRPRIPAESSIPSRQPKPQNCHTANGKQLPGVTVVVAYQELARCAATAARGRRSSAVTSISWHAKAVQEKSSAGAMSCAARFHTEQQQPPGVPEALTLSRWADQMLSSSDFSIHASFSIAVQRQRFCKRRWNNNMLLNCYYQ